MATINYCRGTSYPTNLTPANEYGLCFYDSSKQRPFYLASDGSWKDASGFTQGLLKGTSSQRPTLTSNDAGYVYFDTSLGYPIWFNGTSWVEHDGEAAGIKRNGTTSNRPTPTNVGFAYFDTSIGKMIVWNGSAWVNMDGTSLT